MKSRFKIIITLAVTGAATCFAGTNEFAYSIVDDHAVITGYIGTNSSVRIPSTIEDQPVTQLRALRTPRDHWVEIDSAAHRWKYRNDICPPPKLYRVASKQLKEVILPASVTNLSSRSFEWCPRLASITVEQRNPAYSSQAGVLMNKNQTTLLLYPPAKKPDHSLPASISRIGIWAIADNPWLENPRIPKGVTHLETMAIKNCPNLQSVILPESVESIAPRPVTRSKAFHTFRVHPENPNFSDVQGMLLSKEGTQLIQCPPANTNAISLLTSVKIIGGGSFYACQAPIKLKIPDSVTRIEASAFQLCSNLETMFIPASVLFIEGPPVSYSHKFRRFMVDPRNPNYCSIDGVLFNKDASELIQFPAAKEGIYTVPASVSTIGSDAFRDYAGYKSMILTNIVLRASVDNRDRTFDRLRK